MKQIKVSNLSIKFEDQELIRNLSFNINEGDRVAIVGPSGIGKTTIINALLGEVEYSGTITNNMKIEYIPQELNLIDNQTALENLLKVPKLKTGKVTPEDIMKAQDLINTFFEDDISSRKIRDLSVGMKRRIQITRAFMSDFDLIILDESFVNIDEKRIIELINWINEVTKNKTIIMISHDIELVSKVTNKKITIKVLTN